MRADAKKSKRAGSGGTRTPYHFLYIEFVVGVFGFRRNQRGKIPEIIPVASTGSGETWVLTIHPIWTGAGSGETRVLTIHPIWAGAGS